MNTPKRAIAAIIAAVVGAVAGLSAYAETSSYEEPTYRVVSEAAAYQVRQYDGWLQAQVTVTSSYETAVRGGFQILAGYIFGGNQSKTAIAMTTPVATVPSEAIDMTAPVSATGAGDQWTVSFMMPKKWTMDTLPEPNDPRILLVEVAPTLRMVKTFSGRASKKDADRELAALLAAVEQAGLEAAGPPAVAQFNAPWVLGPWRRNEVSVPVRDPGLPGRLAEGER